MENKQVIQDPGRADYVPTGKRKKYARRFEDKAKVWMKVATEDAPDLPDIVVYVKEGRYDEEKEGWVYKVQEQDKEGVWYGPERWKREKGLKRA